MHSSIRLAEVVSTKGALGRLVELARSGPPTTPRVGEVSAEHAVGAGTTPLDYAKAPRGGTRKSYGAKALV